MFDGFIVSFDVAIRMRVDLTRFNKIAIQGTPQMAVDKEARAYRESTHIVILGQGTLSVDLIRCYVVKSTGQLHIDVFRIGSVAHVQHLFDSAS